MKKYQRLIGDKDILAIAESVALEKNISKEIVFSAIENAIAANTKTFYSLQSPVVTKISRKTGDISSFRALQVVEDNNLTDSRTQISLTEAVKLNPEIKVGEDSLESLPPIVLARNLITSMRSMMISSIQVAEKEVEFNEFNKRKGEVVSGIVKKVSPNFIMVSIGKTEAIIYKEDLIPADDYKIKDKINAVIKSVLRSDTASQIILSRTNEKFLEELLKAEIPSIYEGNIEIKAIARDPGSRAKVVVFGVNMTSDVIGACVGVKGSRVQGITHELKGEKIDIIEWKRNISSLVSSLMLPAKVSHITIDETSRRIDVIVPQSDLSIAIGKRGQNVRLASKILDYEIRCFSEEESEKKKLDEFEKNTKILASALNVEEVLAQLLVSFGYSSLEKIVAENSETLATVEGFNPEIAEQIKQRAASYLETQNERLGKLSSNFSLEETLINFPAVSGNIDLLEALGKANIKTLTDLADLATDELLEVLPAGLLSEEKASEIIMSARKNTFLA